LSRGVHDDVLLLGRKGFDLLDEGVDLEAVEVERGEDCSVGA
jgi:hypothetical protein